MHRPVPETPFLFTAGGAESSCLEKVEGASFWACATPVPTDALGLVPGSASFQGMVTSF